VPAVDVRGLRKVYPGGVEAVKGINLAIAPGEVFGLLGPNGAGKSTTIGMLTTTIAPTAGTARLAGFDVVAQPLQARRVASVVFQEPVVDRALTARRNLLLHARLWGVDASVAAPRVAELADALGIAEHLDRPAGTYSGGQRRRLEIARALVSQPRVLFLDEPTTGLDPEARVAMWAEVSRLAEAESLTILLTTHYLEEADQLANRLAIVSRGAVVVEGTPEDLKRGLQGEAVTVELVNGRIDDAIAVVGASEGARETAGDGQLVRTRVPNGAKAIPGILSALEGRGIQVASVTTSRPSLDDVYLHYTGRDFASEDAGR
jgi:ABC-2 type transport system ATP-binding protein